MSGKIENKGRLIILAGASGSGKDAVMNEIIKRTGYSRVITCCAGREIRADEVNGIDYHFLSIEEFKNSINKDEFLEWYPYRETLKGTRKGEVQRAVNEVLIWRIDPVTAAKAKDLLREKGLDEIANEAISVFVGVDSVRTLYKRQESRNPKVPKEIILKRMREDWKDWKKYGDRYDLVVMNKDGQLDAAVEEVLEFVTRK